MTSTEARTHIRYSGWASRRVLEAVEKLTEEERSRPMKVSHESMLGTLGHIHFADRIWYSRTVDTSMTVPPMAEMCTLEALTGDWQELQRKWEAWAEVLSDADLERVADYKYTDGRAGSTPVSQIVLHLVNHATLHRGQVVGMLRQVGARPPVTDFIFYLRDLPKAESAG